MIRRTAWAAAMVGLFASATAQQAPVGTLYGPVPLQQVIDGDTITLYSNLGPRTVRLIGIDAPELDTREPLGSYAAERMRQLLPTGSQVWVETDLALTDLYGRLLGYVYAEDPDGDWQAGPHRLRQLNLQMLEQGWARTLEIAPNNTYADLYAAAEVRARGAGLGIWDESGVTAAAEPPGGPIAISCVLFDPDTPSDASGETVWLDIREPLDTRGYYLHDTGSNVRVQLPHGVQQPGELAVTYMGQQGIWNNGGDTIYLYVSNTLVDSWEYDGSGIGENVILCRDGSTRTAGAAVQTD